MCGILAVIPFKWRNEGACRADFALAAWPGAARRTAGGAGAGVKATGEVIHAGRTGRQTALPQNMRPPLFDTSEAHIARVYNYWLGGKDHFAADRELAERFIAADPEATAGVRANRAFLGRAVHFLAAKARIRQFLDIGTGIPTANNTHEVAQRAAPDSRIVYVHNDPIVLAHARALLTSDPGEPPITSMPTCATPARSWRRRHGLVRPAGSGHAGRDPAMYPR